MSIQFKKLINVAAALLHHPRILIMDEPTAGIDPQSRNHILETVLKLNSDGMTVALVSVETKTYSAEGTARDIDSRTQYTLGFAVMFVMWAVVFSADRKRKRIPGGG